MERKIIIYVLTVFLATSMVFLHHNVAACIGVEGARCIEPVPLEADVAIMEEPADGQLIIAPAPVSSDAEDIMIAPISAETEPIIAHPPVAPGPAESAAPNLFEAVWRSILGFFGFI